MTDKNKSKSILPLICSNEQKTATLAATELNSAPTQSPKPVKAKTLPLKKTQPRIFAVSGNFKFYPPQQCLYKAFRRSLGALLYNCRMTHHLGLEKVAKDLKISSLMLDNIEIGKKSLFWYEIDKLLEYYQLTLCLRFEDNHAKERKAAK